MLCAVTLRGLLQQFVAGDTAEFEAEMHDHAERLKQAPFGEALLWTVGYVYEHKGLQALGGIDAALNSLDTKAHGVAQTVRVAQAASTHPFPPPSPLTLPPATRRTPT